MNKFFVFIASCGVLIGTLLYGAAPDEENPLSDLVSDLAINQRVSERDVPRRIQATLAKQSTERMAGAYTTPDLEGGITPQRWVQYSLDTYRHLPENRRNALPKYRATRIFDDYMNDLTAQYEKGQERESRGRSMESQNRE